MKTDRITVNKTAERPEGIEIEIVQPETPLEERLISFMMMPMVRELKRDNRIPYDLPARLKIEHIGNGTFLATGQREGPYYENPNPIAILGLRIVPNGFDLIHAEPRQRPGEPAAAAPSTQPAAVDLTPPAPPAGSEGTQGTQPA